MDDTRMIWLDLETTGLDPTHHIPLEIGIRITDAEGIGSRDSKMYQSLIFEPDWYSAVTDGLEKVVKEMHTKSGLIADMVDYPIAMLTAAEVEHEVLTWLEGYLGLKAGAYPMCGSTINFDRSFLLRYMPKLHDWFHYRNVDVSTLKTVARLVNPRVAENVPVKRELHRVLADIEDSVNEYRYYLDNFLHVDF